MPFPTLSLRDKGGAPHASGVQRQRAGSVRYNARVGRLSCAAMRGLEE